MPLIVGLSGRSLTADERAFLSDARPLGIILFSRNVETPEQLRALIADCRTVLGGDAWILVDQEGGRVSRLQPPHWPLRPAPGVLGGLALDMAEEATYISARLIADDLHQLGITVDCWPLVDLPADTGDPVIGDRAFGSDPERTALIARSACMGLLDGGVLPVLKHIPGHGRARADSHKALPVVEASADLERDFAPFKALNDMPVAMTAHVAYAAIDATRAATISPVVIEKIIRGKIGFDGVLMSDDLTMAALSGSSAERAAAALGAGCDLALHCSGDLAEMKAIAGSAPAMTAAAEERIARAHQCLHPPKPFDRRAAQERLRQYIGSEGIVT